MASAPWENSSNGWSAFSLRSECSADGSIRLGSVLVYADANGAVVRRRVFEPFGKVLAESGTETPAPRYAGEPRDGSLRLYPFGARWYDAESGGFTGVDPLIGTQADPKTHNGYAYVGGDPANYADPSGMDRLLKADSPPRARDDRVGPRVSDLFITVTFDATEATSDLVISKMVDPATGAHHWSVQLVASRRGGSAIASGAEAAFRWLAYDYEEPLGGSYLLETATLIPIGKVAKGGKLLKRGITVLGHKSEYLERAAELGARYLKVPDEIWGKWSDAERWAANSRFLDRAIEVTSSSWRQGRAQQERAASLRESWSTWPKGGIA